MPGKEDDPLAELQSSRMLAAVALIVCAGIVPSLRMRMKPAADGSVAPPPFAAGQRGIGLLVLGFVLMAVGGGTLARADAAAVQLRVLCADGRRRIGVRHAGAAPRGAVGDGRARREPRRSGPRLARSRSTLKKASGHLRIMAA